MFQCITFIISLIATLPLASTRPTCNILHSHPAKPTMESTSRSWYWHMKSVWLPYSQTDCSQVFFKTGKPKYNAIKNCTQIPWTALSHGNAPCAYTSVPVQDQPADERSSAECNRIYDNDVDVYCLFTYMDDVCVYVHVFSLLPVTWRVYSQYALILTFWMQLFTTPPTSHTRAVHVRVITTSERFFTIYNHLYMHSQGVMGLKISYVCVIFYWFVHDIITSEKWYITSEFDSVLSLHRVQYTYVLKRRISSIGGGQWPPCVKLYKMMP